MKLISLNLWGGKVFMPLIDFIKQSSSNTDIFCLQEVFNTKSDKKEYKGNRINMLDELKLILSDFLVFFFPTISGFDTEDPPSQTDFDLEYGSAIFVKNYIKINSHGNILIFKDPSYPPLKPDFSNNPTPLQYITFNIDGKEFAVFNFHGTSFPGDKLDTKRRLNEAKNVKEIVKSTNGAKILVGDFNLLPQTKSIKIQEENMKNLIKEFNIPKTRSDLSPFFGKVEFQNFADYTFVSNDLSVESFQVPYIEISDHLPMILEFS